MKRDPGIRKLPSGVWQVQVSLGRDSSGRYKRLSRNVSGSLDDARRERARMLLEAGKAPPAKMTYHVYVEDYWLPSLDVRDRTYDGYVSKLEQHVLPVIGHADMESVSPLMVERMLSKVKGSARTQHHVFAVLRASFRQAVRWRIIERDPTASVSPPRVPRRDVQVASADEAKAIVAAFRGHPLEPVVVIAIACGLRRSELAALTWADVDLKAATVDVSKGLHQRKGKVYPEPPKTDLSRRVVSIPAWAVEALKPLRGLGPLVPGRDGKPMKPDTLSAAYHSVMVPKEGDPPVRYVPLRDLRHSAATLYLQAGVDPVMVARMLGHSTVSTTDKFYLRPLREASSDAAAKMDALWSCEKLQSQKESAGHTGD